MSASVILFAAEMTASSGVTDGLVMYLCLKNTVSDTRSALVLVFQRFQHRLCCNAVRISVACLACRGSLPPCRWGKMVGNCNCVVRRDVHR